MPGISQKTISQPERGDGFLSLGLPKPQLSDLITTSRDASLVGDLKENCIGPFPAKLLEHTLLSDCADDMAT